MIARFDEAWRLDGLCARYNDTISSARIRFIECPKDRSACLGFSHVKRREGKLLTQLAILCNVVSNVVDISL